MPVHCDTSGEIAVITVENPPVNALAQEVRAGIRAAIEQVEATDSVKGAVMIGAGTVFIAGADIKEFGKPPLEPGLRDVIAEMEVCSKPLVAAIHGIALGGGLETAFGCHYRVAVPSANVGLPEVKLGILPGAGGTQRMPRVAGLEFAIDAITSGRMIPAAEALENGIIDAVIEGDLLEGATAFAAEKIAAGGPHPKIRDIQTPQPKSPDLFETKKKELERRSRGQMSPITCLASVKAALDLPFDEGLVRERELFTELVTSDQSRGMIHAFFTEREVAKIPGLSRDVKARQVKTAAVIGAGTMGGGITMCFANAGIPVTIIETTEEALDRGLGIIKKNYEATASKGRLTQEQVDERLGLITGALDLSAASDADLIIEAVFEDMDVKKQVFTKLDEIAKPGAVLATNTSTLDIDEIASVTKRPEDVIGMHFFSPANVMRLLEVVRGAKTAPDVIQTAMKVGRPIGKVAVLVRVCDGFVGNRILANYGRQANYMIEDGAMPVDIDRVMTGFGMPMGIFQMGDLAGIDVGWRVRQARGKPGNQRYSGDIADRIYEMGRYGQKTSAGWYRYEAGSRVPIPDPEIEKLILEVSASKSIERREIGDEEILKRILYAMVNEGAKILEEGMAIRSSDIDVIYVNGYGFPPYRGGPMFHADQVGLANVLADIKAFQAQDGQGWEPAPLLERLVAEGKSFKDLEANQ